MNLGYRSYHSPTIKLLPREIIMLYTEGRTLNNITTEIFTLTLRFYLDLQLCLQDPSRDDETRPRGATVTLLLTLAALSTRGATQERARCTAALIGITATFGAYSFNNSAVT